MKYAAIGLMAIAFSQCSSPYAEEKRVATSYAKANLQSNNLSAQSIPELTPDSAHMETIDISEPEDIDFLLDVAKYIDPVYYVPLETSEDILLSLKLCVLDSLKEKNCFIVVFILRRASGLYRACITQFPI